VVKTTVSVLTGHILVLPLPLTWYSAHLSSYRFWFD